MESRYAESLKRADPVLAEVFAKATADLDAQRWDESRAGFERILAAVPDHAPTMRRLAFVFDQQKRTSDAISWARKAAKDTSDVFNQMFLAELLSKQSDPDLRSEAMDLARSAYHKEATEESTLMLAQTAIRMGQLAPMREATAALEQLSSKEPAAQFFLAIGYAAQEEWSRADAALDKAVQLGLPAEAAADMRSKLGIEDRLATWRYVKIAGIVLGAWILGLGLIYFVGRFLSRRILGVIERALENPDALVTGTRGLRKAYAFSISAAAYYYFLSMPVLLAVVIGGAVAILWAIWMIGYIPIKLVIIVAIGVLATVWSILRSLFVRRPPMENPGRPILPEDAPKLWSVLREVAGKVGTRPVDRVFMTMGTELAVTERGPLNKRMRDQGERILMLGAGLLSCLTISELKVLLAHEYGHFSNRDTAGGDLAMTVNASLFATAISLAQSGVSAINPAWQFLRLYSNLFARITLGASRLQEMLADRFAALLYGPAAFAGGLSAVVRRSVWFDATVKEQVRLVEQQRQPIKNIYTPPALTSDCIVGLDNQFKEAMEAKPSEFDSHPPPNRRIALLKGYPEPAPSADADDEAWSLFPNREFLEADFTGKINDQLRDQGVLDTPLNQWGQTGPLAP